MTRRSTVTPLHRHLQVNVMHIPQRQVMPDWLPDCTCLAQQPSEHARRPQAHVVQPGIQGVAEHAELLKIHLLHSCRPCCPARAVRCAAQATDGPSASRRAASAALVATLAAVAAAPAQAFLGIGEDQTKVYDAQTVHAPNSSCLTQPRSSSPCCSLPPAHDCIAGIFCATVLNVHACCAQACQDAHIPAFCVCSHAAEQQPDAEDMRHAACTQDELLKKINATLAMGPEDDKESAVRALKKDMNDWTAKYRNSSQGGRPSFSNLYSVVNALAGHWTSFGADAPVPKKRLARISKVRWLTKTTLLKKKKRLAHISKVQLLTSDSHQRFSIALSVEQFCRCMPACATSSSTPCADAALHNMAPELP
jgi:Photosystem II Pbs27